MRRHISLASAALCLAAVSAAPAQAQLLKRIKQAATEKIADKAVDKAVDRAGGSSSTAPADAPADASGGSTGAAPGVNHGSQGIYKSTTQTSAGSSKVEITNERITQFIDAMGPVIAAGREVRAERAAKEQLESYHKCSAEAMLKGPGTLTDAQSKESERLAEQVSALSGQMLAASGSRDTIRINQANDSIQVLSDKQMRLIYPAIAKCGPRPAKRAPSNIQTNYDGTITNPAPSRIAGMTPAQFGRMRERIALYLVAPQKPNDLSPEERGALDARSKDLADISAGFKSNLYNWQSWSELWNAWK